MLLSSSVCKPVNFAEWMSERKKEKLDWLTDATLCKTFKNQPFLEVKIFDASLCETIKKSYWANLNRSFKSVLIKEGLLILALAQLNILKIEFLSQTHSFVVCSVLLGSSRKLTDISFHWCWITITASEDIVPVRREGRCTGHSLIRPRFYRLMGSKEQ